MRRIFLLSLFALMLPLSSAFSQEGRDHNFESGKSIEVFDAIYRYLDMMYVDTISPSRVVNAGITGMLNELDPYTEYYPEERQKELKELYTGKFAGVGAIIRFNQQVKNVVIDEPYRGMPADEAGLRKGDIILAIDDSSMVGKDVSYVSSRLRGNPETTMLLKYKRPSTGKTSEVRIMRRTIQNPSVPFYGMQNDSVGYLKLVDFTENSSKAVRHALVDLRQKGARKLVLDLRNNGGGSELEAVKIVNLFVNKGVTVVSNRGKLKRVNHDYQTTEEPLDTLMPVVVLVNGGSASASEIVSGALQDLDRAIILGTRTYGKGLVQMTVELPYNGNLKLTTSKYYIPSGRCIQAIDYSNGNSKYKEHIPDSLTRVFHTASGREVRDGGGIMPDVEVRPDSLPNIAFYLASSAIDSTEVLHNYVIDYIASHPTIAPARDFEISDSDYESFKSRVLASGFTYDRQSEKFMKNLEDLMKFEGYYDDAKTEFEALKNKLSHNLAKELDYHRAILKEVITSEIVTAYHYQSGAVENSLRYDKQMKEALRLMASPAEYSSLLRPKR